MTFIFTAPCCLLPAGIGTGIGGPAAILPESVPLVQIHAPRHTVQPLEGAETCTGETELKMRFCAMHYLRGFVFQRKTGQTGDWKAKPEEDFQAGSTTAC